MPLSMSKCEYLTHITALTFYVCSFPHRHPHCLTKFNTRHSSIPQNTAYSGAVAAVLGLCFRVIQQMLLLLSCPACYALSLAGSQPIHSRKAMISMGSALVSSLWDRNVFPKVSRRSWLHAGHFPRRCSLSSSSMLHVSHVPSSSRPILFLYALSSAQCPVLICASVSLLSCELSFCRPSDVPLAVIYTVPPTFVQFPFVPWLHRFIVHCCSCLVIWLPLPECLLFRFLQYHHGPVSMIYTRLPSYPLSASETSMLRPAGVCPVLVVPSSFWRCRRFSRCCHCSWLQDWHSCWVKYMH